MSTPKPLKISDAVPNAQVERMLSLLSDARLPEEDIVPGAGWDYGIPLSHLKELRRYWLEEWSWDETLKSLDQFKHFTVELEGVDVHYIHAPSPRSDAVPIILTHGWPGSVFEFIKVIEPLRNPPSAGDIAFHVVVPSLPGYGFSGPPPKQKWTLIDTGRIFNTLMTSVLGYQEYVAQGGDWGVLVTKALSTNHAEHCKLAHFNNFVTNPPKVQIPALILMSVLPEPLSSYAASTIMSPFEKNALTAMQKFLKSGQGYYELQKTKPATIGYALYDSPLGLLAYIGEKYHEWTDPGYPPSSKDIINTIALYYLTGTFHTSTVAYYESFHLFTSVGKQPASGKAGISYSKHDILACPQSWAKRNINLVYYKTHEKGGHFIGMEQPDTLVTDLREFVTAWWKA